MMNQAVKRSLLLLAIIFCLTTAVISAAVALTSSVAPSGGLSLSLSPFATGLSSPVSIATADDGYGRLFIVERVGRIQIVEPDGSVLPVPFLDISSRVTSGGEMGLLGLAFHPNYRDNGTFYVNYTNGTGSNRKTRISQFKVTADPNIADPDSEDILLTVVQPDTNHNAGDIHFGPDGYLYIPLGDGGSSNDPNNNAQDLNLALGKIVRIDVDSAVGVSPPECNEVGGSHNYAIPASNPFVGGDNVCDLIWAIGLRNPWRSSFDRLTGDLYLGDVGQFDWEEVDYQPVTSAGGENYGWSCYEGNHDNPAGACQPEDVPVHTPPILEFVSSGNCSVISGYVYRGTQYPAMNSHLLVTDYCSGNFWDLVVDDTGLFTPTMHTNLTTSGYVAFGEANDCELYLANINNGTIYHMQEGTRQSAATGGTELCNNRPLALADSYETAQGQTLAVSAPGVLDNDSDLDSDSLTAVLQFSPANGTLSLNPNGSFIYTPTTSFFGVDSFTYRAMDTYDESGLATVTITVTQENMVPVAVNDIYTTTQNLSLEVMAPGVLDNDVDGDGDDLTAVLDTLPSNGNLTLAPNGAVIYTPTTDFTGTDSFTYHAFDGLADSNVAMVVIDVVEGNAPPVAISNTYTTTKDIPLTVSPPGVLINDTDPNGDDLTAVIETTPTNGSITLNLDGSFTYTPTLGFSGTDTFTYRAHDGLSVSNAALVTILVAPTLQYSYIPYVILKP